ncbi:MAG: hypothetical protein U1F68_05580 [Gammaproteobacteria bacterium]
MTSTTIAVIVLVCVFCGALGGMYLRIVLPEQHFNQDARDVIKLGMGLIATMTALVLGLVIASAKSSFDMQVSAVKQSAADMLLLDRVLAHYGPETKDVRAVIRRTVAARIEAIWPLDSTRSAELDAPGVTPTVEGIEAQIRHLSPQNDDQRWLQSRALSLSSDLQKTRWLMLGGVGNSIPIPFLVVVVFWLTIIFGSFGLFAPRNATVITALFVCALSVATSIFLILEMDRPFDGLMKVSSAPVRYTFSQLGQ